MDVIVKKAKAQEMLEATRVVYDNFPYSQRSLGILGKDNGLREFFVSVVRNKNFDRASMLAILVNCLFLCFDDPLHPDSERNKVLAASEIYFLIIFTIEMVFKIVAMGFCRAKGKYLPAESASMIQEDPSLQTKDFLKKRLSYLGDYWNWLDFTVVMIGFLAYIPGVSNVSALRTFRVLRPLKTLSSFPSMRVITVAMMESLGELLNVLSLCLFFFFVFGIIAIQLYNGAADGACFISNNTAFMNESDFDPTILGARPDPAYSFPDGFDEDNCALSDPLDWPANVRDQLMISPGDGRTCAPVVLENDIVVHRYCGRVSTGSGPAGGYGPSYGTGNFDNIGVAVLSIFTAITLEGWVDEMYMLKNGFPIYGVTAMYFVILILLGSFFMLNLALAVIENAMTNATEDQEAEQALEDAKAAEENDADGAEGDQFVPPTIQPGFPFFRKIVEHSWFNGFIVGAILANTIVLAMEYHAEDPIAYESYDNFLGVCNYIFTAIFFIEMVLKLLGLARKEYFADGFNCFDFVIVMVSIIELVIELSGALDGGTGLSALRAFRLFRLFKLAKSFKTLGRLLVTLQESVIAASNASILLFVMMFIFVLLGMQLFGEAMSNPCNYDCDCGAENSDAWDKCMADRDDYIPRGTFSDFAWGLVTVFQVLTGENWNEVLYNGIQATSYGLGVIYFVMLNLIGNYIILNIFMAILLGNMDGDDEDEDDPPPQVGKNKVLPTSESGEAVTAKEKEEKPKVEVLASVSAIDAITNRATKPKEKKEGEFQLAGKAFFLLSPDNCIRKAMFSLIMWPPFDQFILFLIFVSSVLLAMDEPHLDPNSQLKKVIDVLDLIIAILFICEAAVKILAFGFVGNKFAYLHNPWNMLDFTIVMLSIIDLAGVADEIKALKALRALRALRPLRVLNRAPNMKLVVNSIIDALPGIANVAVVCSLFYLIFGIIGVQNWRGGLYYCSNPAKLCKPQIAINVDHPALECDGVCNVGINYPKGLSCHLEKEYFDTFNPSSEDEAKDHGPACGLFDPELTRYFPFGAQNNQSDSSDRTKMHGGGWTLQSDEYIASGPDETCGNLATPDLIDECVARSYCDYGDATLDESKYTLPADSERKAIQPQVKNASFCKLPAKERWNFEKFKLKEKWVTHPQHFDNTWIALWTVFEISTGEMWPDIMYTIIDVVGPDQPMFINYNKNVAFYFIAVQIVCAFLLLNLFVGVVVDQYEKSKEGADGGGPLMSEEQKMWIETQKLAFTAGPVRKVNKPTELLCIKDADSSIVRFRGWLFDIVQSRTFEMVIMAFIMLNVITMAMRKFGQSDEYTAALEGANWFFIIIFTIEAVAKIFALGPREYWVSYWNRFDFTLVVLSFVGKVFNVGQFATLLRIARVARMFRLIQTQKSLRDLCMTLFMSLPSISNVASVTLLVFFIFAALGMNLFAHVKYGENLTEHANFNTFLESMLLLFRMSTGESYNGVMHDVSIAEPFCDPNADSRTKLLTGEDAPGNCGNIVFAYIYFMLFFILSAMLMLNLLVAIILSEYSDQEEQGHLYERVSPDSIEDFQAEWMVWDPKATGFMPLVKLEKLIMQLPVPLGTRKYTTNEHGESKKAKVDEWADRKPARKKMAKLQCIERNGKVSFHEVLSGLVANAHADIDLAGLAANSQWQDELLASTQAGPAHKFMKKAEKESHRPDAARNVNGDPFTVEEVTSALMMQNAWRRHQNVRQNEWSDRQRRRKGQQQQREADTHSMES